MAASKISALTEDTAPHGTNDYGVTYDASAVATKRTRLRNFGAIPLVAYFTSTNPSDATTYYFGNHSVALTTSAGFSRIYIQRAGIITDADIFLTMSGTGSNETSTMSIRLNNTTDTTILSTVVANASAVHLSTSALSLAVAYGDYVEIKWVTPTWGTNPTGVYGAIRLLQV